MPKGCHPCRSVEKCPKRKHECLLTDAQFARLGRILDEGVGDQTCIGGGLADIRLLMLTGYRKNEILKLRRKDVDLGAVNAAELHHADDKTGPRAVQMPAPASRIYAKLAGDGIHIGSRRVAKLMREMGLAGVSRRKRTRTTRRDHGLHPAPLTTEPR